MSEHNESRRKFIKATAYTAPVILTLKAAPTFAKSGSLPCPPNGRRSRHQGHNGRHQGHNRQHSRRWW